MNDMELVRFTAWVSAGVMLISGMGTAATETALDRTQPPISGGHQEGREIGVERMSMEKGGILTAI